MGKEQCKIRTSIGGQALIEGVMMRGPRKTVATVRNPQGELVTREFEHNSFRDRHPILKVPVIRGVAGSPPTARNWRRNPGSKSGWKKRLATS